MLLRRGKVVSKEEEEAGERERGERKGGDGESEGGPRFPSRITDGKWKMGGVERYGMFGQLPIVMTGPNSRIAESVAVQQYAFEKR